MSGYNLVEDAYRAVAKVTLLILVLTGAGCDLDVSNPGPVADEFLDDPDAFEAVVNAAIREHNLALVNIGVSAAVRTRELHAGSGNSFLRTPLEAHLGEPSNPEEGVRWSPAAHAVWLAERGIERFERVLETGEFNSNEHVASAFLWAGYSNRLFADYFCEVLWDGGEPQPPVVGLEKAEDQFTQAIEIAEAAGSSHLATSARAGRAGVRVLLGDWEGAVTDARAVPTDFEEVAEFFRGEDWRRVNGFYEYGRGINRALTVWNTPFEEYYEETGDPRTSWRLNPDWETASGTLPPWGAIPFYQQTKYEAQESPIRIASGREMRLIEAEAALRDGDVGAAMGILNDLRTSKISDKTGEPLEPWEVSNEEEAWSALKFERMVELWLEGRRLGDRRRWAQEGAPGELRPEELGTTRGGPDLTNMVYCEEIPNTEREQNPNLETIGG